MIRLLDVSRDDLAAVRRAARFLTPASLRLTSDQPRRLTFLCEARRRHGETLVELAPLAGPACAGEWGVLDFRLDGRELTLAGTVVAHGADAATLSVRRPLTARPPRQGRLRPAEGALAAVFVPDDTGLGRCCQPVLDVGSRVVRIASRYPFAAGVRLRDVVILAGAEVVRRADGIVSGSTPALQPDGTIVYHCAVRLRRPAAMPPVDDPADTLEITEPERVRSILWALCDLAQAVTVRAGEAVAVGRLTPVRGSRDSVPELCCVLEEGAAPTGTVQVECALYGSGYRLYGRVRRVEGRTLHLAPAPLVREWHRREEERLALPAGVDGSIAFRHPVDGRRHRRSLLDVSVQGFGFEPHPVDDALWPGLPLGDVRVSVAGHSVRPARAAVRSVADRRCGVQMEQLPPRDADRLRAELLRLATPPIEFHDGDDLDAVLALHRAVHLLEPDMERNLGHTLAETRRGWRAAHRHPDGLMRTACVPWKGGLGATATLVRAYERSWVFQHLAVASPAVPTNPGLLHSTLVRLVSARPDCDCFFTFADEEARSVHTVLRAFLTEWSTPEHRGATPMALYAGEALPAQRRPAGARRLRGAEEALVEHAARRVLHPICARALGLQAGELALRDTAAAWRRVGLERGREAWGAFRGGHPVAVLLREWAAPGLSLSSLLGAAVYLPVRPDPDGRAARALARVVLAGAAPGSPPVRFVFVPAAADRGELAAAGLRRVAGCTLYAFAGAGMQEYHRYVATRYGFLHGRLRARTGAGA